MCSHQKTSLTDPSQECLTLITSHSGGQLPAAAIDVEHRQRRTDQHPDGPRSRSSCARAISRSGVRESSQQVPVDVLSADSDYLVVVGCRQLSLAAETIAPQRDPAISPPEVCGWLNITSKRRMLAHPSSARHGFGQMSSRCSAWSSP